MLFRILFDHKIYSKLSHVCNSKICKFTIYQSLSDESTDFSHYQDALQAGIVIKLYILINIHIDKYGEKWLGSYFFAILSSPKIVHFTDI